MGIRKVGMQVMVVEHSSDDSKDEAPGRQASRGLGVQREVGAPTSQSEDDQSRAVEARSRRMSRWRGWVMVGTEVMRLLDRVGAGRCHARTSYAEPKLLARCRRYDSA